MTNPNTSISRVSYRLLRGRPSPLVTVDLFHDHQQVNLEAYVDSGSYYSIFLADVAEALGIQVQAGRLTYLAGSHGQFFALHLDRVGIRIADHRFTSEVGFSSQSGIGFNLLGRYSIFNQLRFCFDDRHNVLDISQYHG